MARQSQEDSEHYGIIMKVIGELTMLGKDGSALQLLQGDRIYPGDALRVGSGGAATIKMMNGEIVELPSNSFFTVAASDQDLLEPDVIPSEPSPIWQSIAAPPETTENESENSPHSFSELQDGLYNEAINLNVNQPIEQVDLDVYSARLADYSTLSGIGLGDDARNTRTNLITYATIPGDTAPLLSLDVTNGLSSNYAFAFAEGDADKSISGISNQIIDDDNYPTEGTYEEISGATVMIKTPLHGDQLSVNAGGLPSGITAVLSNDGTSVTLSGSTTALKYQEALKQINFSNVHENPIPGAATSRDIEIAVVVSDSRGRSSDEVVTPVTLTDENDAPVLSLSLTTPSTFTVNFTEAVDATASVDVQDAGVAVVGNNIVITDIDDTLLSIVYLEMSNSQPEDVLESFDTLPDGIIEFPSGYDADSGKFRMALFAPLGATAEGFNTALKRIRYSNNSDTPDTTDRIISITVRDETALLSFSPPDLTLSPIASASVSIVPTGTTVTDLTADPQFSATVTILNGMVGDELDIIVNALPANMKAVYNPDAYVMKITSLFGSTPEEFQQVLDTMVYSSSADAADFNDTARNIRIEVFDKSSSIPVTTTVHLRSVNDNPESADKIQAADEDQVMSLTGFPFFDAENHELDHIKIESLPDNGRLYIEDGTSQTDVVIGQQISSNDIEKLRFVLGEHESGSNSFTFKVHDGSLYSKQANTYTMNIIGVVDEPGNQAVSLVETMLSNDFSDAAAMMDWQDTNATFTNNEASIRPGGSIISPLIAKSDGAQKYILTFDYEPSDSGETLMVNWGVDNFTLAVGDSDGNGGQISDGQVNKIQITLPYVESSTELSFVISNTGSGGAGDIYTLDNILLRATSNDILTGTNIPGIFPTFLAEGRTSFFDDIDGSEEQAVIIYGLKSGSSLWDGNGNHLTYTASVTPADDYVELVNGTGTNDKPWDLSTLRVTPPPGMEGNMTLTIVAGANEGATARTEDLLNPLLSIAKDSNAKGQIGEYTDVQAPHGQLAAYAENILVVVSPVNNVMGTSGSDTITVGGVSGTTTGDDLIASGAASDIVTGGGGRDTYKLNAGDPNSTSIQDFVLGGTMSTHAGGADTLWFQAMNVDAINNLAQYFELGVIDANENGDLTDDQNSTIKFKNNINDDFDHEVELKDINFQNLRDLMGPGTTNVDLLNNLIANGNIIIGDAP